MLHGRISPNHSAFRKRNEARVTRSSSRKAVTFSSPRTTKRFPLSRCASATKIVGVSSSCSFTFPQYKEKPGVEHGQDEDGYAHIVDDIVIENRSRFEVV